MYSTWTLQYVSNTAISVYKAHLSGSFTWLLGKILFGENLCGPANGVQAGTKVHLTLITTLFTAWTSNSQPIILEKIPKIKTVEEAGIFPNRNKQKHQLSQDVGDKVKAREYQTLEIPGVRCRKWMVVSQIQTMP